MDSTEAKTVLARELDAYRHKSTEELTELVASRTPIEYDLVGPEGTRYHIDITVRWNDRQHGDIRITGTIECGGEDTQFGIPDTFIESFLHRPRVVAA